MIKVLDRMRRTFNLILNQSQGRIAILLYHRVAEHVPDPQLLCVSPSHFEEHLQHLREHYHPVSMLQLNSALQAGQVPHKAVVITFDDGYVDNLWNAKPLLERYDCPATVFAVTGLIGKDRELVSDELERLMLESPKLPNKLELSIAGRPYSWELGGEPAQLFPWDVTKGSYPTLRHKCYYDLHKLLRPLDQDNRGQTLAQLWNWAGHVSSPRPDRKVMNENELCSLARGGLVDIGAHTVNHLILASQSVEIQRREIINSKERIEEILGHPVTTFAYPYGGGSAVSSMTVKLVRETGFNMACDNVPKLVNANTNLMSLPRYLIRDWSGDEFARRLESFF
jgi:peptidoglycan/xylan/chitin deacetylase (PgdA/CDA1 family)